MSDIFLSKRVLKKKLAYVFSAWGVMPPIRKSINEAIEKSVAADVAPVVHGRWIWFKEPDSETGYIHMRCSVCSAYWSDPSHADHFRYCPNCGAKMDGKERQNNE